MAALNPQDRPPLSRLLTMAEVTTATTYSRPSIYRLCAQGRFPRPIKLGAKIAFVADEIEQWIASRGRALPSSITADTKERGGRR